MRFFCCTSKSSSVVELKTESTSEKSKTKNEISWGDSGKLSLPNKISSSASYEDENPNTFKAIKFSADYPAAASSSDLTLFKIVNTSKEDDNLSELSENNSLYSSIDDGITISIPAHSNVRVNNKLLNNYTPGGIAELHPSPEQEMPKI